jgi:MoaA/NifB/PqqE/SkfB family radical SAM enzyme
MDLYSIYNRLKTTYAQFSRALPGGYALPPLTLVIELTYRCNLNCEMCYQRAQERTFQINPVRPKDELTFEQIQKIVDQSPPYCIIIFSGGEPFCRSDILDILTYTAARRKCHIVTNSALIKTEMAHKLVDLGLLSVGVSIDGRGELHDKIRGVPGTFERMANTVSEIRRYRESQGKTRPVLNFKTVISSSNLTSLSEIYAFGKEMGADYCTYQVENTSQEISALRLSHNFDPYQIPPAPIGPFDIQSLESELKELERIGADKPKARFIPDFDPIDLLAHYSDAFEIGDFSCQAPWLGINISPYGDVFPCFNYDVGNVKDHSVLQLWNSPKYREFRQTLKQKGLFPGCVGCCDLERKVAHPARLN